MSRKIKEHCGLFGVYNHSNPASLCAQGLFTLQHRGEEGCGIAISDQKSDFKFLGGEGYVNQVFDDENLDEKLSGSIGIGHTRYSIVGSSSSKNIQPIVVKSSRGEIALAHNGSLSNLGKLKKKLDDIGTVFSNIDGF